MTYVIGCVAFVIGMVIGESISYDDGFKDGFEQAELKNRRRFK